MSRRSIVLVMLVSTIIVLTTVTNCGKKSEEPPKTDATQANTEVSRHVEMNLTFDIPRSTTLQAYRLWVDNAVAEMRNAEGCVCCFVSHNIIDCPEVKLTAWWESLAAWNEFTTSPAWIAIRTAMNSVYASDINAEFWRSHVALKTKQTEEPPEPDTKRKIFEPPVEVNFIINLEPGVSHEQFKTWVDNAISTTRETPGNMLSFSSLNIWDSPEVQWTSWWTKLRAWTEFSESEEWQDLLDHLHSKYGNTINIEIWELEKEIKTMKPDILFKKKPEEPPKPDTT